MMQMLISGAGAGVDTQDMRTNVQYAGSYHEEHPIIIEFWKVGPRSQRLKIEMSLCLTRPKIVHTYRMSKHSSL